MLEVLRRGQRFWTAMVIVFVGGVFAVFIGLGGPLSRGGSVGAVVVVGPYRMGIGEFERARAAREQALQQSLGEAFDSRKLRDTVELLAAQQLVQQGILALEAERLGLTVAKKEVEREVLMFPGFRDENGRFDREAFGNWVSYEFGSEKAFRDQQRRTALATKLLRVIQSQARVSEGEARESLERKLETVRIAFPVLDGARIPDDFARDEAAIDAFLAEREAEARALYEKRADEFDVPEQTRARHILIRVAQDAPEEEAATARGALEAAVARIRAGEEFAVVAEEVSQDPGSAASGGDLGFFRRGQMVPAFDEVAFSLEPGVLSEPVRSAYGWHAILVEERKAAEHRAFEDVQSDLAYELLGQEAGEQRARQIAQQLSDEVRAGKSLEQAAREADLTLERSGWLSRRADGFVAGLGPAPELLAEAFTLEPGQSSPRVFEVDDKLALVQVLEHQSAPPEEVETQLAAAQRQLTNEKVNTLVETWVNDRRQALAQQGQLVVNLELIRGSG